MTALRAIDNRRIVIQCPFCETVASVFSGNAAAWQQYHAERCRGREAARPLGVLEAERVRAERAEGEVGVDRTASQQAAALGVGSQNGAGTASPAPAPSAFPFPLDAYAEPMEPLPPGARSIEMAVAEPADDAEYQYGEEVF